MSYFPRLHGVFVVVIALSHAAFAVDNETLQFTEADRTWTDVSGEFQVAASLVGYRDRTLILETANDKEISISLDRISKTDQRYTMNRVLEARFAKSKERSKARAVQTASTAAETRTTSRPSRLGLQRASKLYGIDWHPVEQAEQLAATDEKPILWFRVLGDMTGFM